MTGPCALYYLSFLIIRLGRFRGGPFRRTVNQGLIYLIDESGTEHLVNYKCVVALCCWFAALHLAEEKMGVYLAESRIN